MTKDMLWEPLQIGDILLKHRVICAPMTRCRAHQSTENSMTWVPNDLMLEYYLQRTTSGGLLITEATPVNLKACSRPGIPGIFTQEQIKGWTKIVDAVHEKGGLIYSQYNLLLLVWHQGRTARGHSESEKPWGPSDVAPSVPTRKTDPTPKVPHAMSVEEIEETMDDYVQAAKNAVLLCKFDGIEIHAANGYLPDQFHHSNINNRTDQYGGDYKKRCNFTLQLVEKLCKAIGSNRVAVRLAPFGLFNDTRGEDRIQQWVYLCKSLSDMDIAYIHLIEPRFDEIRTEADKIAMLNSTDTQVTLEPFRNEISLPTKVVVAGGYTWDNSSEGLCEHKYHAVAFGRYFTSNPDLVDKLKLGKSFYRYWRDRFYGPFDDNALGYTYFKNLEFANDTDKGLPQLA